MSRRRLDLELVRRGLAESRSQAATLVEEGRVTVRGIPTPKPSTLVSTDTPIVVSGAGDVYVGRGGLKLEAALDSFGIDVEGRQVLDAGASTGGFTDCLLRRGAVRVVAVDVGYGQLHPRLASDPRVEVRDRTNLRQVTADAVGGPFDLVTVDLSFISVCTVASVLADLVRPGGDLVVLVKPQFEVGKGRVGKGGIVRDPALQEEAVEKVSGCLSRAGFAIRGVMPSPIRGSKGNQEWLLWAKAS